MIFKRLIIPVLLLLSTYCVKDFPDLTNNALLFAGNSGLLTSGPTYTIGGTVSGLSDPGLVISAGTQSLTINASGAFTFPDGFAENTAFNVTITSVPSGYNCTINNNTGTLTADYNGVTISCVRVFSVTPSANTAINVSQPIVIQFTNSMQSCEVNTNPPTNNLGTQITAPVIIPNTDPRWTTTTLPNDTLTLTPDDGTWDYGHQQLLHVFNCQAASGGTIATPFLYYMVASSRHYVATPGDGGNDSGGANNCSNPVTPCATIQHAITQMPLAICGVDQSCSVLIADGSYDLNGTKLVMQNGVSLLGSYSGDFSTRQPFARSSAISSSVNGAGLNCSVGGGLCLIEFPAAVTSNATTIEGFTINGPTDPLVAGTGIEVNGGYATIRNNTIDAGDSTVARRAIVSAPGIGQITRINTVRIAHRPGSTTGNNVGISAGPGDTYVFRSNISGGNTTGGAGEESYGIRAVDTNAVVIAFLNRISAGTGEYAAGIDISDGADHRIYYNLINSGIGITGTAAVLTDNDVAFNGVFFNNILTTQGTSPGSEYCVVEEAAGPTAIASSNTLFNCRDGYWLFAAGGISGTEICSGPLTTATVGVPGTAGCAALYPGANVSNLVAVDPQIDTNMRYTSTSPCISAEGGIDPENFAPYSVTTPLFDAFAVEADNLDINFDQRPGADTFYSIGPDEPNVACVP